MVGFDITPALFPSDKQGARFAVADLNEGFDEKWKGYFDLRAYRHKSRFQAVFLARAALKPRFIPPWHPEPPLRSTLTINQALK
jgi:hypothetical protein